MRELYIDNPMVVLLLIVIGYMPCEDEFLGILTVNCFVIGQDVNNVIG